MSYIVDDKGNAINKSNPFPVSIFSNSIPADYVGNTEAHTPGDGYIFFAIHFLTNSVISAYSPALTGTTFTGVTIPAGTILYQDLTTITLTSGSCIAYKKPI